MTATIRTVLIGLDGATFSILDPLIAQGVMPFLSAFVDGGVRADLRSIVPPLTPPAWTSLMTGRSPGHHGIFDFFQPDSPGGPHIRLATSKDIRCETVGSMANRHGLRATVLNFPVTFPPPTLDGNVISGWMPWRQLRLGCHPAELYDRLKARPGFNPREQGWLDVLRYLMREDPAELTAILFDGPDKIQHLCWRFLDPALWPAQPGPAEQIVHDLCLNYFRQLDQALAEVVAMAGAEATIVIASDHGFGATTEVFHVNTWLEQAGYLAWSNQASLTADKPGTLGMNYLARHVQWLDWTRTTAYTSTPTGNGIHIVKARRDGEGISREDYEAFREELIQALSGWVDPATGKPVVARIWKREEAFAGPAMLFAPDLTLALRDGGLVSILPSDRPLTPRPAPAGTHRPLGVFVIGGPGVRQGATLHELSILDVAPTLLYSLGLPIPEDLEGHVPLEIFEPALRARRPVQIAPRSSANPPQTPAPNAER